jgi:hypothetical protein
VIFEFEILLVAGALAFYAYDAATLLFADEIMLEKAGRRWREHGGSAMLLGGKRPFVPSLLAPYRPLLRVSVQALLGEERAGRGDLQHFLNALLPFKVLSMCLLVLFVPLLPLVLYGFGTGVELLCWFAAVYLCVAGIAYPAFRRRRVLELSLRECALLAFECACCAPFAINIVRKLTLRIATSTLRSSASILDSESRAALLVAARERVDDMLVGREPGTPQASALLEWRGRLAPEVQAR